jgi:hypothetical protein
LEALLNNKEKQMKFRLLELLGQLYNIIIYIYYSSSRITRFKAFTGRIIPLNNRM